MDTVVQEEPPIDIENACIMCYSWTSVMEIIRQAATTAYGELCLKDTEQTEND